MELLVRLFFVPGMWYEMMYAGSGIIAVTTLHMQCARSGEMSDTVYGIVCVWYHVQGGSS